MGSIFPSCPLNPKFISSQDYPKLQIFKPYYLQQEKNELIERIQTLTHKTPQHFNSVLDGICHPHFKITVFDTILLQDLRQACSALSNHPYSQTSEQKYWQEMAFKVDQLMRKIAAFPFLNLPHDLVFHVMSYLPLSDFPALILATSCKTSYQKNNSNHKKQPVFTIVKEVIGSHPELILKNHDCTPILKARACHILSKEWRLHNVTALSNLFAALHSPTHRTVRSYYLSQMKDAKLFQDFLNSQYHKDNTLIIDILPALFQSKKTTAYTLPPLLKPNTKHLNHWNKLIESYSHIEYLEITAKLHDDLSIHQRKQLLLEIIGSLQNVKQLEMKIHNLTQTIPVYFPSQLEVYRDFIRNFKNLKTLIFNCKDSDIKTDDIHSELKRNNHIHYQIYDLFEAYRKIATMTINLLRLLHWNLPVQMIQIHSDCLPNLPVDVLEKYHRLRSTLYPVPYLNYFQTVLALACDMKNVVEIQLIIPKASVVNSFEDILRLVKPQFQQLPFHKEMKVLDDKLIFIFQKYEISPK